MVYICRCGNRMSQKPPASCWTCYSEGRARDIESKFWDNVVDVGPDKCWEWSGGKNGDGYGALWSGTKLIRAHRFSYELLVGPIGDTSSVLHRCDNPPCVNPSHLFLGTLGDNNRDRDKKKRGRNSRKSHCVHGHDLSDCSAWVDKLGYTHRQCRECSRRYSILRYRKSHPEIIVPFAPRRKRH